MFSYRHYFHAGNQADVFKHCLLTAFLSLYTEKEKPFSAFDLHAGAGLYNLLSTESRKTGEAAAGIIPLFNAYKENPSSVPQSVKAYLDLCTPYMEKNTYPGSPEIIRNFLRKGDFLTLTEMQAEECGILKKLFKPYKNIFVHRRSGYEALPALTPPQPVRGFALFDPSYEVTSDYTNIASSLEKVMRKWNAGIFIVWYPLVERRGKETSELKQRLTRLANGKTLCIEAHCRFYSYCKKMPESKLNKLPSGFPAAVENAASGFGLKGSGLLIINPPWGFEEKIKEAVFFLKNFFM